MTSLKARLARLDNGVSGKGKLVVLTAAHEGGDIINSLAREVGVDPVAPQNLVIVLRTFYEDRSGSIEHRNHPRPRVLTVCDRV